MKSDVLEFPIEQDLKAVDENGYFIPLDKRKEIKPISQYWTNKNKLIGAMLFTCSFVLILILVSETDVFNVLWQGLLGGFGIV